MNFERERRMAEDRARAALTNEDWRGAAYSLFNASRMSLCLAGASSGRTKTSLVGLARRYEAHGDKAMRKARQNGVPAGSDKTRAAREDASDEGGRADRPWVLAERPDTRLADVAGMAEVKDIIEHHILLPMRHPDVYKEYRLQPGSGVLMYGPPGTGKTFMAKAIAGEVDAAFVPVEMKRVLSKWFGETERLLGDLFEETKRNPRTVIFFDEAEALFPKRGENNSSVMARVVPQLLQLINGLDATQNCVVLLGATNRPWLMDEAATRPDRFGRLVHVGPPDLAARAHLFKNAMKDVPVDHLDHDLLARRTEGYSGADIAGQRDSVCVEAKMAALRRTLSRNSGGEPGAGASPEAVTMADFETALGRVRPSIRESDLKAFAAFAEKHASGRG